jgi:DNA invertase Pin-like site-specific DNA recombinase
MKACIYARSSRQDKGHHGFSIARQEEDARDLSGKHGLTVSFEHVFTDMDHSGEMPPTRWITVEGQEGRPALSALITAVEEGKVKRVIVRKMDRLGTTSEVLMGLLELFTLHDVFIVATPETVSLEEDPTEAFAVSVLLPRIQYDTDEEIERKAKLKLKKLDEIKRLKTKIDRLEQDISELGA